MQYPEIISIPNNPALRGMAQVLPDLVYSSRQGQELKLHLILPWEEEGAPRTKKPLIVFLQGSAWTTPNIWYQLPQLSRYAQNGYAVATLVHRDNTQGHAFPAYLVDSKCAIRYLRAHADEYGLDAERVCFFGTSSGGNTALLVGLTGNDPRYESEEYLDQSDAVSCVIDCFGPANMNRMIGGREAEFSQNPVFMGLQGKHRPEELLRLMSPILEIKPGQDYPPFLLIHGDRDDVVPFDQSEEMFRALIDAGQRAQLIRVIGAPHEGNFWSERLHGLIADFLGENL